MFDTAIIPVTKSGPSPNQWSQQYIEEEDYHAMTGLMSSSMLASIDESGRHFEFEYIKGNRKTESDAMTKGKLLHKLVLEPDKFVDNLAVMPEFWGYTQKGDKTNSANCKEVKQQREAWLADHADSMIVTQEHRDDLLYMSDSIRNHPEALSLLSGEPEKTGFFHDDKFDIPCRLRIDNLRRLPSIVSELKTARCAKREFWQREVLNRKYDLKAYFYLKGVSTIEGSLGWDKFAHIVVENVRPYNTSVFWLSVPHIDRGELIYNRSMETYLAALKSGKFHGYQKHGETLLMTDWQMKQMQEEMENAD